jgi:hypothetical protein
MKFLRSGLLGQQINRLGSENLISFLFPTGCYSGAQHSSGIADINKGRALIGMYY